MGGNQQRVFVCKELSVGITFEKIEIMKSIKFIFGILSFLLIGQSGLRAQYANQEQADKLNYTVEQAYETVQVKPVKGKKVKNVILMIGDGMGLTQISMAWVANQGKLNVDNFPYTGLARTYAGNKLITDSGAAGTAMATGQKTRYHSVGVDMDGNPLTSLTDLAHEKGLGTGVVVTCGLTDATPAAFCSNHADREQLEAIAAGYLNCNVDFIFGGGRTDFNKRSDERNLLKEMEERGYQIADSWAEVEDYKGEKLFAVVDDGQLPLAKERGDVWQKAALKAIDELSKHKKGFFAMLEGSRIDDCGHWNDVPALMGEIFDFDQTIGKVLEWAEKDGETLVVVLADHETGGLTLLDGSIEAGQVEGHFSTGGHSGIIIPVFAYGPGASEFSGTYENTDVFRKIAELLKLQ